MNVNVESGTEAVEFLFWEYINGICSVLGKSLIIFRGNCQLTRVIIFVVVLVQSKVHCAILREELN